MFQWTEREKDLLARRKSQDLTLREFLEVTCLQTAVLLDSAPDSPAREALGAELKTLIAEIVALPAEPTMRQANDLQQRAMTFHRKVMEAVPR